MRRVCARLSCPSGCAHGGCEHVCLRKHKAVVMGNEHTFNELSAKGTVKEQQSTFTPQGRAGKSISLPLSLCCIKPHVHVLELVTLRPSQI